MKFLAVIFITVIFIAFALISVFPAFSETESDAEITAVIPQISAASAILINADTGTVIYEKNSREKRAIASTTKIMTTLLTLEAGDLNRNFTVDPYAIKVEGTSMGLREGDIVSRRALCYGMLLPSGNDAANAAAVSVSGTTADFARLMNKKAIELGMTDSNFVNPSGLDADGHYSTAADMAKLTMAALRNAEFREICGTQSARVEYGNPPYLRTLANNNKLLHMYEGCIGVKTGFTDAARRCLVSAAVRGGSSLICVTLNAPDDWNDHSELYDYGFGIISNRVLSYDESSLVIPVVGGDKSKVRLYPETEPCLSLSEEEAKGAEIKISVPRFLYGGFEKDFKAGYMYCLYNGKVIKAIPLLTMEGAGSGKEKLSFLPGVIQFIRKIF